MDALYKLSEAYDHHRFVSIISATGSASDVVIRDQYGSYKRMEVSYMTSISKLCLVMKMVIVVAKRQHVMFPFVINMETNLKVSGMDRLIAAGPVEIIADTSKELKKEKKDGGSSAAATSAPNGNMKKLLKN